MRLPLRLVSILAFLALWAAAAGLAGRSEVPGPLAVLTFVVREAADGTLFYHLAVTLARVVAAFLIAMAVGAAIGVAMGQHSRLDRLLDPWIILLINIPALVVIVLRSEEHTSELQSLMRISYAVFCL